MPKVAEVIVRVLQILPAGISTIVLMTVTTITFERCYEHHIIIHLHKSRRVCI